MNPKRERLKQLVREKCLDTNHSYTLSTGQQSEFYFDCKKAMLDGESLSFIAEAFLEEAAELPRFPQSDRRPHDGRRLHRRRGHPASL